MVLEGGEEPLESSKEVVALLRDIRKTLVDGYHVQEQRLATIEAQLPASLQQKGKGRKTSGSGILNGDELPDGQSSLAGLDGSKTDFLELGLGLQAVPLRVPLGEDATENDGVEDSSPQWQTPWQGQTPRNFLSAEPQFLETNADWKRWFHENMWIPADPRLSLMFDTERIKQCRDIKDAITITKRLHAFNQILCNNGGSFLVVDNIGPGSDKLFGNMRRSHNQRSIWYFDGHMYLDDRVRNHTPPSGEPANRIKTKAPERRLIIIDGLVDLRSKDLGDDRHLVSLQNFFCPPQPVGLAHNVLGPHYLNSYPHFHRADISQHGNYRFCYSWFRIVEKSRVRMTEPHIADRNLLRDSKRKGNILRAGHLYGSDGGMEMITRDSYLLDMVHDKTPDESANNMYRAWTAVNLRMPFSRNSILMPTATYHAQIQILNHSNQALLWIEEDTRAIADHIDNLLGIGDSILMDPNAHDNLLFDDDTFSRSRRYWWVLNMLTALRQGLSETLRVRQELREAVIEPLASGEWPKEALDVFKTETLVISRLINLQHRLENQHQRAEILRSGLFNASGVVESRASTRLGEIVKLLTYVSIFYLPLSFATSLWQTTPYFQGLDNASLFGAMIVTGTVTYLLVFNLNNLVRTSSSWYERVKTPWLARMQNAEHENEKWTERATKYRGFQHRRSDSRPSEWWVVWYVISWPLRLVRMSMGRKIRKDEFDPELDLYLRDFFPSLPDMVRKTELKDGWAQTMPSDADKMRESADSSSERRVKETVAQIPPSPSDVTLRTSSWGSFGKRFWKSKVAKPNSI